MPVPNIDISLHSLAAVILMKALQSAATLLDIASLPGLLLHYKVPLLSPILSLARLLN